MVTKTPLPQGWAVPELFKARLGESAGRQRAMEADDHLLLVLHAPPDPDNDIHRQGRLFWRQPDGNWKSNDLGTGIVALRTHLEEYAGRVEKLEDELQAADTASDYFRILQEIAPLHRSARNSHAALQQAREMFPADRDLISSRDRAGDIERAAELLHGDAKNGLDFTMARQAEQQARSSYAMAVSAHRLNVMAALFLPLATISSLLGMNLVHGMETWPSPQTFLNVVVGGIAAGLILALFISPRARAPEPPPTNRKSPKKPKRR